MLWNKSKNGYTFSDVPFQGLAADQAVQQQNLYGSQLDYLQNPNAIRQEQEGVYRSAMIPAFESERNKILGQARAQLGNRYKSTFGALTMEDAANKQAVQRAGLEKTIYDSGQAALDRELARLGLLQGQAAQQVSAAYAPMIALKDLQQGGSANFGNYVQGLGNYNAAQVNNFNNQLAAAQYAASRGGGMGSVLGGIAGGTIGAFFGNPMLGAQAGAGLGGAIGSM